MTKIYILLLLLITTLPATAQNNFFTWSAGAQDMNMSFVDIEVMDDNSIVVVAATEGSGYKSDFRHGNGEKYELSQNRGSGSYVIKFSPEGLVEWHHAISEYHGQVYQVEKNEAGEIILLASINDQQDYDKDEEPDEIFGALPSLGIYESPIGAHILHLSAGGSLLKTAHIEVLEEVDLENCKLLTYLDGNFLLAGTGGGEVLAPKLDKPFIDRGNEFLLMIDPKGELIWGDLVFYRNGGGYMVGGRDLTYGPDGVIYLGGTYIHGATFSNGLQTLVPISYEESQKSYSRMEGYIIAYDPSGAIKWVKTEGCESILNGLAATVNGVFVGHQTRKNKLLGERVDTTGRKQMGISFVNKKGKTQWTLMAGVDQAHEMHVDQQGNLLMLGTFRIGSGFYHNSGKMGDVVIPEKNESFIASITAQGIVQWVNSADLWITTGNDPFVMDHDLEGNVYIAGVMWLSLPFQIRKLDASLPDLNASGGVSILGKVNPFGAKNE